jgi:Flp pilus assembly protein TadG
MRHGTGQRERRRGQSVVEMAIIVPLLFVLFLGILDFARVFYNAMTITHAAREGAQYGAQNDITSKDFDGMKQAALATANDIPGSGITADAQQFCKCSSGDTVDCITGVCPEGVPQVFVQVTVEKVFTTLFPYPGVPHTTDLRRQATIRVQ